MEQKQIHAQKNTMIMSKYFYRRLGLGLPTFLHLNRALGSLLGHLPKEPPSSDNPLQQFDDSSGRYPDCPQVRNHSYHYRRTIWYELSCRDKKRIISCNSTEHVAHSPTQVALLPNNTVDELPTIPTSLQHFLLRPSKLHGYLEVTLADNYCPID